jgi:hypothetical protein
MINYYAKRELITVSEYGDQDWDINNPLRLDEYGNQITLLSELQVAIPNKINRVLCVNENVTIECLSALTTEEQQTKDTVIYNHKNNL